MIDGNIKENDFVRTRQTIQKLAAAVNELVAASAVTDVVDADTLDGFHATAFVRKNSGGAVQNVLGTSPIVLTGGEIKTVAIDQTLITHLNKALSTGLVKIETSTGELSSVTDNSAHWDLAYDHSVDNSQAHSDYMLNTGDTSTGNYDFTAGNLTTTGDANVDSVIAIADDEAIDLKTAGTVAAGIHNVLSLSDKRFGIGGYGSYRSGFLKNNDHEFFHLVGPGTDNTVFGGSVNNDTWRRFTISTTGSMSWGAGTGARDVTLTRTGVGELQIGGDLQFNNNNKLLFGTTNADLQIYSDGTNGIIRPGTSLNIGDGTNDTRISATGDLSFVGDATVWNDLQFQVSSSKVPAANFPSWEAFTTNTYEYAFDVDEYAYLMANEVPHSWKEGTAANVHLHVTNKTAQNTAPNGDTNQYAKFTIYIAYADVDEVWQETSVTAELTIPTGTSALTNFYLDMGDLTLTNYLVGVHIKCTVKRIAATGGTEYADSVFISQVGMHLEEDTVGSRTELVK